MKLIKARKATLIKRETDDGIFRVNDGIELGKEYIVDLYSIRNVNGFNTRLKVYWEKEVIDDLETGEYLPTEMIRIEKVLNG